MAWDHIDLITDSLSLGTHEFSGAWIDEWGIGTFYLDASEAQVGNYAIKNIADLDPEFYGNFVSFKFDTLQDLSAYQTAEVWIKWKDYDAKDPDGPGLQGFGFVDDSDYSSLWELEYILVDDQWHKCKFDFSNFDGYVHGSFDITSVRWIIFDIYYDFDVEPARDWEIEFDGLVFYSEREWDASTNTLWSEATNWTGDNVPDQVDEYSFFKGSVTNDDCLITPGVTSPGGLAIESDYTGTVYSPDEASYWGNPKMNISIAGGTLQASGSSLGFAGSSIIITGGVVNTPFYSITDTTSMIQIATGITLDSLYFHQDGSTFLVSDVVVQNDISFGTGGAISILNLGIRELLASGDLLTGDGAVGFTLDVEDLSALSVNSAYFGNEDNGTVMTIGASGGVPWDYDGSGDTLRLGYPSASESVKFFGPSAGGSVNAPSATLEIYDGGEFYSYGGDVILDKIYVGSGGVLNMDGGSLTLYGDVYSEGYIYADVDATNIFATIDVLLEGAGLWNLNVDSGGNNITVTVSGGTIYGKIDVASGDNVVLTGGADWAQAQVKWNQTTGNDWNEADNWQLNHIPEPDDIAWFDGSMSTEFCILKVLPFDIPEELLVGPDYKGPNAYIRSWGGGGFGNPQMKITVLGDWGDYFFLNAYNGIICGDIYAERGILGESNSKLYSYGDVHFAGEHLYWLYSMGTDDRTWYFETSAPDSFPGEDYLYNSIWSIEFEHYDCNVSLEGEIHVYQYFQHRTLVYDDLQCDIHLDGDLHCYRNIMSTNAAIGQYCNVDFTVASGSKIEHDGTTYGKFTTGGTTGHRRFEMGEPNGYWDFEGWWDGAEGHGGYFYQLVWGYTVGTMPRWHDGSHYPEYAIFHGPAPGYSFVSHECGLHVGTSGQLLNHGGDISADWFEVTEAGYFDQSDGNLIVTGRAIPIDREPVGGSEPESDHPWAIWSTGTWVWTPGASVVVNSQVDVELWGAELPNLVIDSGGAGITVTASGCTFAGQPDIADGDRLIIISDDPVVEEIIPELGITRKVGDYLVNELTVKMERD